VAEETEARVVLTAEDRASATVRRLENEVKRLKEGLTKSFIGKKVTDGIGSREFQERLEKTGRIFGKFTDSQEKWARNLRDINKLDDSLFTSMRTRADKLEKQFDKANKARRSKIAQEYREVTGRYAAAAYFRNQLAEKHAGMEERRIRKNDQLEAAVQRNRMRGIQEEERARIRSRSNMMRMARNAVNVPRQAINRLSQPYFMSPAFMSMAVTAAASAGVVSVVKEAIKVDRAETMARMHMDQNLVNAREMRNKFALPKAIEMGSIPGDLFMSAVEGAKAGIPDKLAAEAEMTTMIAKYFGISVQAVDGGDGLRGGAGNRRRSHEGRRHLRCPSLGNISAYPRRQDCRSSRPDACRSCVPALGLVRCWEWISRRLSRSVPRRLKTVRQGQQAARLLGSLAEDIHKLDSHAKDVRKKHTSSEDDKLSSRSRRCWDMARSRRSRKSFKDDPNDAIFDFIQSFGKIKDNQQRDRALTAVFGADFKRFLSNMVASPGTLDNTRQLAREAAMQGKDTDFLSKSWGEWIDESRALRQRDRRRPIRSSRPSWATFSSRSSKTSPDGSQTGTKNSAPAV
jgi:hypothetical protein